MALFEKAIAYILANEGGLVDHPNDPGGATNYGISLQFMEGAEGGDINGDGTVDKQDIRDLNLEQASDLYKKNFWTPNNYGDIKHQGLATKIFDVAVNMGSFTANKILQQSCNLAGGAIWCNMVQSGAIKVDGKIGPESLRTINSLDPLYLVSIVCSLSARHYILLCENNKKLTIFLRGWLIRARKTYD